MTTTHTAALHTPLGPLALTASDDGLVGVRLGPAETSSAAADGILGAAAEQLRAYFAGRLRAFDLPLAPRGTPFQQSVWAELARIGFGRTLTYRELASRLGSTGAARAVGAACGRNPIAIVVPCHRVVGAGGRLTGYAGGLAAKSFLLELERGYAGSRRARSAGYSARNIA